MINGLLKLTLFAAALRWLKPRFRMLIISVVLLLIVNLAHSQYVEYVTITSKFDYLEVSYLLKFVLWIAILAAYYFFVEVRIIVGREQQSRRGTSADTTQPTQPGSPESGAGSVADGFDYLRGKSKLESRADKVIAGKVFEDKFDSPDARDLKD